MNPSVQEFQDIIWHYYQTHQRTFAWRETTDPYHILVSEIMLQQTQTDRVEPKYEQFLQQFPHLSDLAAAPQAAVILTWQGLGYNRRALALHKTAHYLVHNHNATIPNDPAILLTCPGIGQYTAHSICTFAFNRPTILIETNIRTVFIHFYFAGMHKVHDRDLHPFITATLDHHNPRQWYYALMDYGVMLKKNIGNLAKHSAHYTQQTPFKDSLRYIRGTILKLLTQQRSITVEDIAIHCRQDNNRIKQALDQLQTEGFIEICSDVITLA